MFSDILTITNQTSQMLARNEHGNASTSMNSTTTGSCIASESLTETSSSNDIILNEVKTPKDTMKPNVHVVDAAYNTSYTQQKVPQKPFELLQGVNKSSMLISSSSTGIGDTSVICEQYKTGVKQKVIAQKLITRKLNPRKKLVKATMVTDNIKQVVSDNSFDRSNEHQKSMHVATAIKTKKLDAKIHNEIVEEKQEREKQRSKEIVTSLQPFMQIQTALEDKIKSLVTTLEYANSAEKHYIKKKEKMKAYNESEELKNKLDVSLEELDSLKKSNAKYLHGTTTEEIYPYHGSKVKLPFSPDKSNEQQNVRVNSKKYAQQNIEYDCKKCVKELQQKENAIHKESKVLHEPFQYVKRSQHSNTSKIIKSARSALPKHCTLNTPVPRKSARSALPKHCTLNTPVPRKSAPTPSIRISPNENLSPSKPKMSEKGFALLQELLQESENQVVKSNGIVYENKDVKFDNNLSKTAINQGAMVNNEHRKNEAIDDINSKLTNLHEDFESMIKESSALKDKLNKEENMRDVSLKTNDADKATDNIQFTPCKIHQKQWTVKDPSPQKKNYLEHILINDRHVGDPLKTRDQLWESADENLYSHGNKNDYNTRYSNKMKANILLEHSLSEECPIDKYLKLYTARSAAVHIDGNKENEDETIPKVMQVLAQADLTRKRLETSLDELARQHKQINLFGKTTNERNNEDVRMKKLVDEKIINIQIQIEKELNELPVKETRKTREKETKVAQRVPLYQRTYAKNNVTNKKDTTKTSLPFKKRVTKVSKLKSKDQEKMMVKPPETSTAYDELVMQHLYGKQPYQPRRHTINKQPVTTTTNLNNTALFKKTRIEQQESKTSKQQINHNQPTESKLKFFFYPQTNMLDGQLVSGEMVPMAIPLAEPCTDPTERLPLNTDHNTDQQKPKTGREPKKSSLTRTGPNVAVINMQASDISSVSSSSDIKERIKSKVRDRMKKKMKLRKQPLPNMDIDSPQTSSFASTDEHSLNSTANCEIGSKSYNFQDFVAIRDVDKSKEKLIDETSETECDVNQGESNNISPSQMINIDGGKEPDKTTSSSGPCFPPQQMKSVATEHAGINNIKLVTTIEQEAQQWLEQELLSRLITMMNQQTTDPTLKEYADNASCHSVNDDSYEKKGTGNDWIESFIGLQGMQLFVDAGIPLNQDTVIDVIRHVIIERLEVLFGYPQPVNDSPTKTTAQYADEIQSVENIIVATPVQTPEASKQSSITPSIYTPERTISDLEEQSINDSVHNDDGVREKPSMLHQSFNTVIVTPDVSVTSSPKEQPIHVQTPTNSVQQVSRMVESVRDLPLVETPDHTIKGDDYDLLPQDDFIMTERSISTSPVEDNIFQREELDVTPHVATAVIPSVKEKVSTNTESYTMSSSAAVGFSTFDGISIGEHLHPSQMMSDYNGSEGEFNNLGLPMLREKTFQDIENIALNHGDRDTEGTHIKQLLRDITHSNYRIERNQPMKSEGEISSANENKSLGEALTDRLKFDEDTFEMLSLNDSKLHEDPVMNMLKQVVNQEKSEGEVVTQINRHSTTTRQRETLSVGQLEVSTVTTNKTNIKTNYNDNSNEQTKPFPQIISVASKPFPRMINVQTIKDSVTGVVPETDIREDDDYLEVVELPADEKSLEHSELSEQSYNRTFELNAQSLDGDELPIRAIDVDELTNRSIEEIDELTNHSLDSIEDDSIEKVNVVLKLPKMEDDFTNDVISQYDLSDISGGEI